MVESHGFPLLSLSSPPLLGRCWELPVSLCSEMLWGGGSDTWHRVKVENQTIIALLDAPTMVFFPFPLYMNIKSYTPHLCMYSCSCSCSFTWLCRLIFLDLTRSLSLISPPSPFTFFFHFSLYATTKVSKQQFSIKYLYLCLLEVAAFLAWVDGGLCPFLERVNTGLSFREVNPGRAAHFSPPWRELSYWKVSGSGPVSFARTEEVGGFGILLATAKAARGARCEVDPILFTLYWN